MASPVADAYTAASGASVYAGRYAPGLASFALTTDAAVFAGSASRGPATATISQTLDAAVFAGSAAGPVIPAWLNGKPLGQLFEIASTAGGCVAPVDHFSGFAVCGTTLVNAACSGHGADDNRVESLSLLVDAPSWVTRIASSTVFDQDAPYNPDGKPAARHTYQNSHFVPFAGGSAVGRLFLISAYGLGVDAYQDKKVDAVDLETWQWDPAGTWTDAVMGEYGRFVDTANNVIYTNTHRKFNPATNAFTTPALTGDAFSLRWPITYDRSRHQAFGIQWADGQNFGSGVTASKWNLTTGVATAITINASAAYSQFIADQPQYAAMPYDPDGDRFVMYSGAAYTSGGAIASYTPSRFFVVTPNAGSTWDMSFLTLAGGSATPSNVPSGGAGINSRFGYVETAAWAGFVLQPSQAASVYFIRTR